MNRGLIAGLGFLGLLVLGALWFVSIGNSLVTKEEGVKAAWSQVENVYQRRADLIPNLVNTVKGYAKHEQETLENVIKARNQAVQPSSGAATDAGKFKQFQQSQEALTSALGRLMVVVEKYPELKANQNFLELQSQLEGTENRIAVERRRFNEVAQDYNTALKVFPSSIVAGMRQMQPRPYFEAQAGSATAPKVEF